MSHPYTVGSPINKPSPNLITYKIYKGEHRSRCYFFYKNGFYLILKIHVIDRNYSNSIMDCLSFLSIWWWWWTFRNRCNKFLHTYLSVKYSFELTLAFTPWKNWIKIVWFFDAKCIFFCAKLLGKYSFSKQFKWISTLIPHRTLNYIQGGPPRTGSIDCGKIIASIKIENLVMY